MIDDSESGAENPIEIKFSHDWFSLGKAMELFQPLEKSKVEDWKAACSLAGNGNIDRLSDLDFDYEIQLKDNSLPLYGTDTPNAKAPNKNNC